LKGVPINEELYNYIVNLFAKEDEILKELVPEMEKAEMPMIQISPDNGKFLYILIKLIKAKNVIEIGTLGGYSTIWMARALPDDGKITTIEISEKHFEFARKQFEKAGLQNKIHQLKGSADEVLDNLKGQKFDFAFLDADKEGGLSYYNKLKPMMNKGGIITADNALKDGKITMSDADSGTRGMQQLNEIMAKDPNVESMLVPISDGLSIAWIK
jgi:predicted O-methyltransferase YrrM